MSFLDKKNRVVVIILLSGLAIFCCYVLYLSDSFSVVKYMIARPKPDYSKMTKPLPQGVIQDLCTTLEISVEDVRCQPDAVVYAPEFFQTIKDTLKPLNAEWANFDRVQEVLGKYQYDCSPIVKESDGKEYFTCRYDLQGDRVFPIVASFYSDGRLFTLSAFTDRDPFP